MSKDLEQLRKLLSYQPDKTDWWGEEKELIALEVNDCLNRIEKSLKALDIIKTKNIDAEDVKIFKTYSSFNQRRSLKGLMGITKEEFEILKDVLL